MSGIVNVINAALRTPAVVEAIVKAVTRARTGREDCASRADVGALKAGVANLQTNLEADTAALKADTADLKSELAALRSESAALKADLKLLKFGYGPVVLALLIKLAFFP